MSMIDALAREVAPFVRRLTGRSEARTESRLLARAAEGPKPAEVLGHDRLTLRDPFGGPPAAPTERPVAGYPNAAIGGTDSPMVAPVGNPKGYPAAAIGFGG